MSSCHKQEKWAEASAALEIDPAKLGASDQRVLLGKNLRRHAKWQPKNAVRWELCMGASSFVGLRFWNLVLGLALGHVGLVGVVELG
jgi:hypothetical protein